MQDKKLILFVAKALGLLLLWIFGYELWLKGEGTLDNWLTSLAASHSSALFSLFGYDISHRMTSYGEAMVIGEKTLLYIAHSCNGLILYAMFAGFILIFSGKWYHKLWYIGAGLALIYSVNILRIIGLSLIQLSYPAYLDVSHKYIFTIVVYSIIFLLWMWWVKMQPVKASAGSGNQARKVHA